MQKIVDGFQSLTLLVKRSILDVSQDYDYTFDNTKQEPGAIKFVSQKMWLESLEIFSTFKFNFTCKQYMTSKK